MEEFIQPIIGKIKGADAADLESWISHEKTFQELLNRLVPYQKVILISGDVHYGFSNEIDYWENRGNFRSAKFVNLTASALKNSSDDKVKGTTTFASIVNGGIYSAIFRNLGIDPSVGKDVYFVGWDQSGDHLLGIFDRVGLISTQTRLNMKVNTAAPFVTKLAIDQIIRGQDSDIIFNQYVLPGHDPQWEYRIRFKMDTRLAAQRTSGTVPGTGVNNHRASKITRDNHTVIGLNNFGQISFEDNAAKVKHTLWMADTNGNFHPFVEHLLNFEVPADVGRASQRSIPA
jgi:hypothetical protein